MSNKKKIIFVNNNMNIGGVQKALCSLLKEICHTYNVTLLLFSPTGDYMKEIPDEVEVITCSGAYKYLGISQGECKSVKDRLARGFLALLTKFFGRNFVIKIINLFQKKLTEEYDCAVSYLHNGNKKSFYGGCNEFVLYKINAKQKVAFLHCDYEGCGANYKANNIEYKKFDKIAACSDGCKKIFTKCVDVESQKVFTVINCHDFNRINELSNIDTAEYDDDVVNIISVARLSQEKGIDRGIKAVHSIIKKGIKVKYHIVGDGIKRNELQELCSGLGISDNIIFYGNSDNPYKYMKNADLLLIPSYHEAAPLVIDEARCLGLPVLSTKTTSTEDMIIKTNSGWMCENSQEGITDLLHKLVSHKELLTQKKQQIKEIEVNNNNALQQFCSVFETSN